MTTLTNIYLCLEYPPGELPENRQVSNPKSPEQDLPEKEQVAKPIYRLVLHPKMTGYAPESWDEILEALAESKFVGDAYSVDTQQRYYIGDQFLKMLSFMGCSPHIEIEPTEPGSIDFCHIALSDISSTVLFRHHERDVFARCPECGRRDANWPEFISTWLVEPNIDYVCPSCEVVISPYALRWRNSAGFANMFIDIFSVYPNEAVPTEQLLSLLKKTTGQDWDYFYCRA